MNRKITILTVLLFISSNLFAETYWIATTGRLSATGAEGDPFADIQTALEQVGGGNTFIFKPGVYNGAQITITPDYSGTPENPTILKSQFKYEAVLSGSPFHNIYVKEGGSWVIIDGFESSGARYTGIKACSNYTVIRNCRIHHNSLQGIEAHNVYGLVVENNLVEFNGEHLQYDHAMYINGEYVIIRNNIIRFNSGWGVHLYPKIANSSVENNLVYGNNRWGVALYSDPNVGGNKIINNTIVFNGGGIAVKNGLNEIIANNIIADNTKWLVEKTEPIQNLNSGDMRDNNVLIDYNLCIPASEIAGPNGISSDPLFLDPGKGTFYLTENSPVIGMGSLEYAPSRDFFDREISLDKAPDLGCFPFTPALLLAQAREDWYNEWPFLFKGRADIMPDLWKLPESEEDLTSNKL